MSEFPVVVVFDVEATSREAAYQQFAEAMDWRRNHYGSTVSATIRYAMQQAGVDAWWFPEADVKHIDGNDCPAYKLVEVTGEEPDSLADAEMSEPESPRDAALLLMALECWGNASLRRPGEFYARISNTPEELEEINDAFEDDFTALELGDRTQLIGHFLVAARGASVTVTSYPDVEGLVAAFEQVKEEKS